MLSLLSLSSISLSSISLSSISLRAMRLSSISLSLISVSSISLSSISLSLINFSKDEDLQLIIHHEDETTDKILLKHTFNENQIEWFKAGSALNLLAKQNEK